MEFDATNFFNFWIKYCQSIPYENWNSNKAWTNSILNTEFLIHFENTFKLKGKLEYRKNDFTVFGDKLFDNVQSFNNNALIDSTYHREIVGLIEHENNYLLSYEEMIKLTYQRAKLKVVITYPESINEFEILKENFLNIISQSNSSIALNENHSTEYLLIIGYLIESKQIEWKNFIVKIEDLWNKRI